MREMVNEQPIEPGRIPSYHAIAERQKITPVPHLTRLNNESYCGTIAMRTTAKAKTATAKATATIRTRRCSNFPEALAKKSTVAKRTVLARYWPETSPASRDA